MTPLERNQLVSVLNTNGFHAECPTVEGWVAADATFAPGRCYVTCPSPTTEKFLVATSLDSVARALVAEGYKLEAAGTEPPDIAGTFHAMGLKVFHNLVRRVFQLSCALPTVPLDRFRAETRSLPSSTEAERTVIQRVGQNIFRNALLEYWSGHCAVTGIDQPELLRASHIKPWVESTDVERLDLYNGFLFVADVDAAFDCGMITFEDDGAVALSPQLHTSAKARFARLTITPSRLLTLGHRSYLAWHRRHQFLQCSS